MPRQWDLVKTLGDNPSETLQAWVDEFGSPFKIATAKGFYPNAIRNQLLNCNFLPEKQADGSVKWIRKAADAHN